MRPTNEVLITFFESRQEALNGLAVIAPPGSSVGRPPVVVVSRDADGSRSPFGPPAVPPFGALIGTALGCLLGSAAGEAGLVIGLFFGLYVGLFVDLSRMLARVDLLDEIQDGLAPGQAALVIFTRVWSAASVERKIVATSGITVHRFPGTPIEDDFAREAREATAELERLVAADDVVERDFLDRERAIAAVRRKLSMLEAMGTRLLWLERLQFEFEMGILNRDLQGTPRWRASRLRSRATKVRASHRRARTTLKASSARVCTAELPGDRLPMPAGGWR